MDSANGLGELLGSSQGELKALERFQILETEPLPQWWWQTTRTEVWIGRAVHAAKGGLGGIVAFRRA